MQKDNMSQESHLWAQPVALPAITVEKLIWWMTLVFAIAWLLRIAWLDTVPANLNPDEGDNLRTYLFAIHTGSPGFFEFNWNGAPAFNTYLMGWAWELASRSVVGLRTMSALFSSVACALFFLFVYQLTRSTPLAFGSSLLLATNPWFLNFSRSGWENSWNAVALLLIMLGFYYLYERRERTWALALLIIGSVLGFYFYHPGKLFAVAVTLILLLGQLLAAYRIPFKLIGLYVATVGLLILPQLYAVVCTGPEDLVSSLPLVSRLECRNAPSSRPYLRNDGWHRVETVSVFNQPEPEAVLGENIVRNVRGFLRFYREDFPGGLNRRYLPTDANPIPLALVVFYIAGLGIAALRFPYLFLFYLLVLLPVQVLSVNTPDAARSVHVVPLIFAFIGLSVHMAFKIGRSYVDRRYLRPVHALIVTLMIVGAAHQFSVYWQWINSTHALSAREPAIERTEYSSWMTDLEAEIKSIGNQRTASPR
jgi:hypothetical protein